MPYFKYHSKDIYYSRSGKGAPLIFLHGDTASSQMFTFIAPLFEPCFTTIQIDFLGNGQSERVSHFPMDIWYDQALQTITLIEHLGYKKVHLLGTSGGAFVAIHVGLQRPDLVYKIVADSFDGRTLHDGFAKDLLQERIAAKQDAGARQFYEWCQGEDWEAVVDKNTEALLQYAKCNKPLFPLALSSLQVPVLFMGTEQDSMVRKNLLEEYQAMTANIRSGTIHMFKTGEHPAILSNAEAAAQIITDYLHS